VCFKQTDRQTNRHIHHLTALENSNSIDIFKAANQVFESRIYSLTVSELATNCYHDYSSEYGRPTCEIIRPRRNVRYSESGLMVEVEFRGHSLRLSVYPLVKTMYRAKTADSIETPYGAMVRVGSTNYVLDKRPERGKFWEDGVALRNV